MNQVPDENGRFGKFGGRYVPETLMNALIELEEAYNQYSKEIRFPRGSPLFAAAIFGPSDIALLCRALSEQLGGAKIYLKREDLNHTGAHKINNTIGQGVLAKRMGKTKIIAETGAGQHGVASATVAALLGHGMQGVHGRGRYEAPAAQRVPHEAAWRGGRAGYYRHAHA